jgi:hypothetical protein
VWRGRLAFIGPGFLSVAGAQSVAQTATETIITFDVAWVCRTFNYLRGLTVAQEVRGDSYIFNGKLFPPGTLRPGAQGNDPNDPGSIGDFINRGTSTAALAEHLANPNKYAVFATSYFLLNDGRGLVTEGWFKPSGANRSAVTGGMGAFRGASGEWSGVDIGTNSTGCTNTRVTISLVKQAPK